MQAAPVYEDALRFLHRDDLADMDITHLHVTDRLEAAWPADARRLLTDPAHFTLWPIGARSPACGTASMR